MKFARFDTVRETYAELVQCELSERSPVARKTGIALPDASRVQTVRRPQRHALAQLVVLVAAGAPVGASAHDSVDVSVEYTGDVIGPIAGAEHRGTYLDNLDVGVTLDMEHMAGWGGDARVFIHLLNNSGGAANAVAETLQGIDNIEVTRQSARLYEFWVEGNLGAVNARAGLYDVNSEFYSTEAAGLLIAPAFGVGSELAASGPNGPSIFPSTGLALRVSSNWSEHVSGRFAVVNAHAGVLGDPDGVDTDFDDGALLIGELSWDSDLHIDVGAWTYSDRQDDIRLTDGLGALLAQRSAGIYLTAERAIDANATAFVRLGAADGDTTPYSGGWQAGVLFDEVFASRPESQVAVGLYQGLLGSKFRANQRDAGVDAARAETGIELTYSDQITPWLRLQPDVQVVLDPNGDRDREDVWIAGLRIAITPFGH